MFFVRLKAKRGLLKTYFLPLISVFTLVNSELRNFSSDKVTLKLLIINKLRCHLSLVTFAITLSLLHFCPCLWVEVLHGLMCLSSIKGMINGAPLTGRVFKIRPIFPRYFMSNKWHFTCQPYPVRQGVQNPFKISARNWQGFCTAGAIDF